jgi:hypothetical protein
MRRLVRDPSADAGDGKVAFRVELSEGLDEGEVERQLLPLLYKFHPALDDTSGRLKQELGVRALMSKGPDFYLTEPDADGVSHFGGVRIPVQDQQSFLAELRALGWSVLES